MTEIIRPLSENKDNNDGAKGNNVATDLSIALAASTNPYPQNSSFAVLWDSLDDAGKQHMRKNIALTADGKIDLIKLNMKLSVVSQPKEGVIYKNGNEKDEAGNAGLPDMVYPEYSEHMEDNVLKEQERNNFFAAFPGVNQVYQREALLMLLGLSEKFPGYFDTKTNKWRGVGKHGGLVISAPSTLREPTKTFPMVLKWTIDEVGEDDMTEGSQVKEVGEDNMPEGSQVKYELITGVSGNDPKMLCPSLAIERYQPKQ